jgi:creatinine amidohydrolase
MGEIYKMDELTWPEFADLVKETDIAIIPVGSMEQHSLHGPLGTDSFIAKELAERIARKVRSVLYPVIRFGHGLAGFDTTLWPGTLNFSAETMISVYRETAHELVRHGLKRLLFVSGHWNNSTCLDIAAFKIWKETGAAVGVYEWFVAMHKEAYQHTKAIHADEVETSLLLATEKADLVRMDRAVENPNPTPPFEDEKFLWERMIFSKITNVYDERYLHKGNFGDPRKATKELGDELLNGSVELAHKMLDAMKKHVNDERIKKFRE